MNCFLIVRLLSAHVVGDFILQNSRICAIKKQLDSLDGWLWQTGHALIHAALTYLFVGEWGCWLLPLAVFISHLFLDVCKSAVGMDNMIAFAVDQILHIGVLAILYSLLLDGQWTICDVNWPLAWTALLAYIIVLTPTAVFIDIFNKRFENVSDGDSLRNGGRIIGYLERIMIVSFILCGWIMGVGYLLAAKSVFRFGDLKNSNDLKRTEYVLVGTFMSFAVGVLVGLAAAYLMSGFSKL